MKSGRKGVIGGINITPLTDIFLVLLIIMMLLPIIQMKELQLNIRPSSSSASDTKESPKTFEMSVLPDKFTVQKNDVAEPALKDELEKLAKEFTDGLVIKVSPESRHEQLAQALSAAKLAGVTKVAVKRLPPEKPEAPGAKAAKAPAPPKPAKGK